MGTVFCATSPIDMSNHTTRMIGVITARGDLREAQSLDWHLASHAPASHPLRGEFKHPRMLIEPLVTGPCHKAAHAATV